MTSRRGLLLLSLPLLAGLGLMVALARRGVPERTTLSPAKLKGSRPGVASEVDGSPHSSVSVVASRVPPAKDLASAVSTARIRTTYKNYRMAVANENRTVQEALLPVLRRDRETALLFVRDELARAKTEQDRAIARRTLDVLER